MSTIEEQILAWAKRSLGFASSADAITFAANGALIMAGSGSERRSTIKILIADSTGVVQWIGLRNVTGSFLMEDATAWLTGVVGESGIAARMTALSAPPKMMRNGQDIVRVAAIKYFMRPSSPSPRTPWLNLQAESPNGKELKKQIPLLRTMSYQDYL